MNDNDWDPNDRLLTIEEAAASIERPASTLRRWISEGRLTHHATQGRRKLFLESDVLAADAHAHRRRRNHVGTRN